jgi:hypothetical protein
MVLFIEARILLGIVATDFGAQNEKARDAGFFLEQRRFGSAEAEISAAISAAICGLQPPGIR